MTTLCLSARANLLRPSPTLAISAKARKLREEGQDVVSFGAGEPDFDTPPDIVAAAVRALETGDTRYTATPGVPALRLAVAEKLRNENGVSVTAEQIVVSTGAKQSLYNALMTLVGPGDEVIVFAPYWMTYVDQIRLAGAEPVVVSTRAEDQFEPDPDRVKAAITDRTKAVIVNSPNNPTGAVYPRSFLEWLAEEASKRNFWMVSDEIYERLVYHSEHVSLASLSPDAASRTITVNGCSKSFAMTGWRIGYAATPLPVAKAMSNLQDQVTSNATSFAQAGAIAALTSDGAAVETMRREFEVRRDLVVNGLNDIPGVSCSAPKGAFYVFPRVESREGDEDRALRLLEQHLVATVPGSVFGAEGHLRLSYATSREDIEKGLARLKTALTRLS